MKRWLALLLVLALALTACAAAEDAEGDFEPAPFVEYEVREQEPETEPEQEPIEEPEPVAEPEPIEEPAPKEDSEPAEEPEAEPVPVEEIPGPAAEGEREEVGEVPEPEEAPTEGEGTPVEEAPETPRENEETPVEEAPETPKEGEETPVEETPVAEAPETPPEEIPTEEAPVPPAVADEPLEEPAYTAEEIARIQTWLIALQYLAEGHITGELDGSTRAALGLFQRELGLPETGLCDPETYEQLRRLGQTVIENATEADQSHPAAPSEYTDDEIRQIQQWLIALGYLKTEDPSGTLDEDTLAALLAFQSANQLDATGALDQATYQLLKELGAAASSGGQTGTRSGASSGGSAGAGSAASQDARLNGVTPGTALTSTHASGSRDTTVYGAIERRGGLKALGIGLSAGAGEASLEPVAFNAAVRDNTLALRGEEAAIYQWTFDGLTLRTLSRSGIDEMNLSGVPLSTGARFTGAAYQALRAGGYTENTYQYTVTVSDGTARIDVEVSGQRFEAVPAPDGGYTLVAEEE